MDHFQGVWFQESTWHKGEYSYIFLDIIKVHVPALADTKVDTDNLHPPFPNSGIKLLLWTLQVVLHLVLQPGAVARL